MKIYQRFAPTLAIVLALLALCLGGALASGRIIITSSSQIKNGAVTSKDVKNNTVRSADLGPNSVTGTEIDPNAVEPSDVALPPAVETNPPVAAVTDPNPFSPSAYEVIGTVGTFDKQQAESQLEVQWSGVISAGGAATLCVYQLRVNGQPSPGGGGEAVAHEGVINVATGALFSAPVGPANIEVWARVTSTADPAATCGVGGLGVASTFIFNEAIQ